MTLNIDLLRRVQVSIADRTKPFNMNDWCDCIAGHTNKVLKDLYPEEIDDSTYTTERKAMAALGLSYSQAEFLFHVPAGRERAIAAIDDLIKEAAIPKEPTPPTPYERLLQLRDNCSAITPAVAGCAASSALASPAQDVKQEQEELVGV